MTQQQWEKEKLGLIDLVFVRFGNFNRIYAKEFRGIKILFNYSLVSRTHFWLMRFEMFRKALEFSMLLQYTEKWTFFFMRIIFVFRLEGPYFLHIYDLSTFDRFDNILLPSVTSKPVVYQRQKHRIVWLAEQTKARWQAEGEGTCKRESIKVGYCVVLCRGLWQNRRTKEDTKAFTKLQNYVGN